MHLFVDSRKLKIPAPEEALPGRADEMPVPEKHFVLGTRLEPPFPAGMEIATFGMGCFWGAEKKLWQVPGVYSTSVGYAGGHTPNPTHREVCSGRTGQMRAAEAIKQAYEEALRAKGLDPITTEIVEAPAYFYAEDYHQHYLAKNPDGYCGLGGTGVSCPIGPAKV